MKIYVGSKFAEYKLVQNVYSELIKMGHTITYDWTLNHGSELSEFRELSVNDINGVVDSDLFIGILINDHPYRGVWIEMGAALGQNIPCYMVGKYADECTFCYHPLVIRFKALPDMFRHLTVISRRGVSTSEAS